VDTGSTCCGIALAVVLSFLFIQCEIRQEVTLPAAVQPGVHRSYLLEPQEVFHIIGSIPRIEAEDAGVLSSRRIPVILRASDLLGDWEGLSNSNRLTARLEKVDPSLPVLAHLATCEHIHKHPRIAYHTSLAR
jgi:hypothetical protein